MGRHRLESSAAVPRNQDLQGAGRVVRTCKGYPWLETPMLSVPAKEDPDSLSDRGWRRGSQAAWAVLCAAVLEDGQCRYRCCCCCFSVQSPRRKPAASARNRQWWPNGASAYAAFHVPGLVDGRRKKNATHEPITIDIVAALVELGSRLPSSFLFAGRVLPSPSSTTSTLVPARQTIYAFPVGAGATLLNTVLFRLQLILSLAPHIFSPINPTTDQLNSPFSLQF